MLTWIKRLVVVIVFLAVLSGGLAWYSGRSAAPAAGFKTSPVTRGDVISTIGATGTLEPEEVIDVGSQVTGQILNFGNDTDGKRVDYTSNVKKDALLAQIDDTTYQASLREAKAQLAQAQAGVLRADADLKTAQAKSVQADRDWNRAKKIGASDALSQTAYDTYQSTYEQGRAAVSVAEASLESAKATVEQAKSAVERADRNVKYCTITSPVDGKIIDRRVNIGQTVVSAMSVSSLFLIAKDLRHMQIWVAVNEADIGSIQLGQKVTYTCDAFGEQQFTGTVTKIRDNAQMTQNVVLYTIEVSTENPDLKLRPYLTANVQFEVARRDGVLKVPNSALRWTPDRAEQVAPDARAAAGFGDEKGKDTAKDDAKSDAKPEPKTDAKPRPGKSADRPATLWVKDGAFVRPLHVTAGLTDGSETEVSGDGLAENAEVVTGVTFNTDGGDSGTTNPFLPNFKRKK